MSQFIVYIPRIKYPPASLNYPVHGLKFPISTSITIIPSLFMERVDWAIGGAMTQEHYRGLI